jgi:hypothetical protein
VALAFTRGHVNQLRGLSLPCAGAVFSMEIEGDDAELEDDGPPEDDGLAEPSLGSMASIISINGCGRRATAVTSRWTTASQASPIRMDWTNRSRSATGCDGDGVMKTPATPEPDWRRRPENNADALVFNLVRERVINFLQADAAEPVKAPVVTLIRSRPDLSA